MTGSYFSELFNSGQFYAIGPTGLSTQVGKSGINELMTVMNTITTNTGSLDGTKLFYASEAQGDIIYRDSSNWARLGAGTNGQVLKTGGAAANPSWGAESFSVLGSIWFIGSNFSGTSPELAPTRLGSVVVTGINAADTVRINGIITSDATASNFVWSLFAFDGVGSINLTTVRNPNSGSIPVGFEILLRQQPFSSAGASIPSLTGSKTHSVLFEHTTADTGGGVDSELTLAQSLGLSFTNISQIWLQGGHNRTSGLCALKLKVLRE